jgi:DNA-binding protein YbaB
MFLEIRFDVEGAPADAIDEEFADTVLTAESPCGSVTIIFDSAGQVRSLDIS